jgi:formate hydrogenlyase subunit 3/multisubunit Na+/H+ antiporter MnhD subunit
MIVLSPLTPIFVLLLGAFIISILSRVLPPVGGEVLAFLTLIMAAAALLLLRGTESAISPPAGSFGLTYRADAPAWLFALVFSLFGIAWLGRLESNSLHRAAQLGLLAAGLSFVFSADLLTLYLSWGLLDLTLFFLIITGEGEEGHSIASRVLVVNYLAGLALLGAAVFASENLAWPLKFRSGTVLMLALVVRAGLYPLHLGLPLRQRSGYVISATAGLYLLARSEWPWSGPMTTVGEIAFVVGAVLAWGGRDIRRALPFVALGRIGFLFALAGRQHQISQMGQMGQMGVEIAALWGTLNFALCLALLDLTADEQWTTGFWARVLPGLAVVSLIGLPLTAGFVERWFFYGGNLLLVNLLAEVVFCAALLQAWLRPSEEAPLLEGIAQITHLAGASLLILPLLILGLHPPLLLLIMGWPVGDSSPGSMLVSLPELWSSTGLALWAALLLPPLGGYLLHRFRPGPIVFRDPGMFWKAMERVFCLEWLYRLLGQIILGLGRVVRAVVWLIEGEHYLGWTILLTIVALFFLLSG